MSSAVPRGISSITEVETPAAAAAREISARLLQERKNKGRLIAEANKAAAERGVVAHKADRDVRDGLGLLEELHRLDSEARGEANLAAATAALSGGNVARNFGERHEAEAIASSEEELEQAFLEAFSGDENLIV
jgi:hypothetical protein